MAAETQPLDGEEQTLPLDVQDRDDLTVVRFTDHQILDERRIKRIEDELVRIAGSGRQRLMLDFRDVKYIASMVLHILIRLRDRLQAAGGHLTLCNVRPEVYEIFQVTHLVGTERGFEINNFTH